MNETLNKLVLLKKITKVVLDTGDLDLIKFYSPEDVTTNPSLILQVFQKKRYKRIIDKIIIKTLGDHLNYENKIKMIIDRLIVFISIEILKLISGKISIEIDSKFAYDLDKSINEAYRLVQVFDKKGIDKKRILIKLPSTWEGICAAKRLERDGINCNLTLLFSLEQAKLCFDAGVYLVSPFVGRVLDWYRNFYSIENYESYLDPGVILVKKIFNFCKKYKYNTIVMGASFRNVNEILELAGCDALTIAPFFLKELSLLKGSVEKKIFLNNLKIKRTNYLFQSKNEFLSSFNQNKMAVENLSNGIERFISDQKKLEKIINLRINKFKN